MHGQLLPDSKPNHRLVREHSIEHTHTLRECNWFFTTTFSRIPPQATLPVRRGSEHHAAAMKDIKVKATKPTMTMLRYCNSVKKNLMVQRISFQNEASISEKHRPLLLQKDCWHESEAHRGITIDVKTQDKSTTYWGACTLETLLKHYYKLLKTNKKDLTLLQTKKVKNKVHPRIFLLISPG